MLTLTGLGILWGAITDAAGARTLAVAAPAVERAVGAKAPAPMR